MVRKQGHSLSNTFRLKVEAVNWAAEQESRIGRGEKPSVKPITSRETLGDLIDLHLEDLKELGRNIGRSKEHTLFRLKGTPLAERGLETSTANSWSILPSAARRKVRDRSPFRLMSASWGR